MFIHNKLGLFELFAIRPVPESTQCEVVFLSNYEEPNNLPFYLKQLVKIRRVSNLENLKYFAEIDSALQKTYCNLTELYDARREELLSDEEIVADEFNYHKRVVE